MKVLYVEDNPANVFLVKRVARMGNHEIINYIDGGQALKKYDEINPDLVLMDIQLAGDKTGLDVVRELRARGIKTTIIAVTAYAMVGDKERCIEAGCDDYLAKPLPIPRLVEIFESHSKKIGDVPKVEAPKAPAAPVAPVPPVAEALKIESAPLAEVPKAPVVPVAETPKSESAPVVEAPKAEVTPVVEAPKVETAPVPDAPKSDAAPDAPKVVPAPEAPKADAAPVAEAPKAETSAEAPRSDAAPVVRTPTAPLIEPATDAKPVDGNIVSGVKAVEETKPAESPAPEAKTAEDGKKVEESSVKPETSSN
jgi:CheY-like chemotaxis protein